MITRCSLLVLCTVALVAGLPSGASTQDDYRTSKNSIQTENDLLDGIYQDCLRKDSISCVKFKLFSFVDKMLGYKDTITVTDGVQIVKTNTGEPEGAPRALTGDETIESLIVNRVQRFLDSHTLKIDIKGKDIASAVTNTARSFSESISSFSEDEETTDEDGSDSELTEEGRGRRKRIRRIMGPLMAAAALKMAIMGKLALAAIALIAGKALLIGKMALVLSSIIGLKKLLGGQGKHVTYEVVSHPQHSSHSTHDSFGGGDSGGISSGGYGSSGHGGWGRSLEAQKLAYKAQIPIGQVPLQEAVKY